MRMGVLRKSETENQSSIMHIRRAAFRLPTSDVPISVSLHHGDFGCDWPGPSPAATLPAVLEPIPDPDASRPPYGLIRRSRLEVPATRILALPRIDHVTVARSRTVWRSGKARFALQLRRCVSWLFVHLQDAVAWKPFGRLTASQTSGRLPALAEIGLNGTQDWSAVHRPARRSRLMKP